MWWHLHEKLPIDADLVVWMTSSICRVYPYILYSCFAFCLYTHKFTPGAVLNTRITQKRLMDLDVAASDSKSVINPVRRLPPEILSHIFLSCLLPDGELISQRWGWENFGVAGFAQHQKPSVWLIIRLVSMAASCFDHTKTIVVHPASTSQINRRYEGHAASLFHLVT